MHLSTISSLSCVLACTAAAQPQSQPIMAETRFEHASRSCIDQVEIKQSAVLNTTLLPESSGIAHSKTYPDRLYHINDSGDGAFFYTTDTKGAQTQQYSIKDFTPEDTEDLAYGACNKDDLAKQCLIIADIGDNRQKRPYLQIVVIEEKENFSQTVTPRALLKVKYPDGARDAESVAVGPGGDLYLLSKEIDYKKKVPLTHHFYRIPAEIWQKASALSSAAIDADSQSTYTMEAVGTLDLRTYTRSDKWKANAPTAMDWDLTRQKIYLLTYKDIVVLSYQLDKSQRFSLPSSLAANPQLNSDYWIIKLDSLEQQEALTLVDGEGSFVFSSEAKLKDKILNAGPLISATCKNKPTQVP